MTQLRKISTEGFMPVKNQGNRGNACQMKWIKIEDLRVDPSYQRNISSGGKSNTRQIAMRFSWRKFTPVIVCRAFESENLYLIIDGQHRTTAAALIGLKEVPCCIVMAPTVEEQADSFKSINANVTRVTSQDIYFADLASGSEEAKIINNICSKADVKIIKHSNGYFKPKVGECASVQVFKQCLNRYSEDVIVKSLECITKTGDGNPGMLRPDVIKAICKLLHMNQNWFNNSDVVRSFEDIDISAQYNKACYNAPGTNTNKQTLLMQYIHPILTKKLGNGGA